MSQKKFTLFTFVISRSNVDRFSPILWPDFRILGLRIYHENC